MSISKRIYIIVAMIGITAVSVAGVGIWKMAKVGNELEEIAHEDIPLTEKVTAVTLHQLEQAIILERALRSAGVTAGTDFKRDVDAFKKLAHKTDKEIKEAEELAQHGIDYAHSETARQEFTRVLGILKKIEKEHVDYEKHAFEVLDAIKSGQAGTVGKLVETVEHEQEKLDHELEALLLELEKFTAGSVEQALADEQAGVTLLLTVAVIGTLAGVAVGVVIGRNISNSVSDITGAMTHLADGDLEAEIPGQGRADEIGEMAAAVQVFKDNAIRVKKMEEEQKAAEERAEAEKRQMMAAMADDFESSVGGVVRQVASASSQMRDSASTMATVADQASQQSSAVAAASEEASTNVQTVASAAEELSSSISEINRQVSKSTQVSSEAMTGASDADQKIQSLATAVDKIGEIVQLITDIAEQTNLLALNATIESARAGEAGRGFAVVASEVKNLATQTGKATEEISRQIDAVRAETHGSVDAIQNVSRTIGELSEISSAIAAAVEEQSAATQEIARNVEQAAAGTKEVNANITQISQASGETGTAAGQIADAASDLSTQSETLQAEVDKFLSQVRAA